MLWKMPPFTNVIGCCVCTWLFVLGRGVDAGPAFEYACSTGYIGLYFKLQLCAELIFVQQQRSKNGAKNCPKFQHLAEFLPNKNSSWSTPRYSHDGLTATIGISPRSKVSRSRPSIALQDQKYHPKSSRYLPCIRNITQRADISPGSKVSRRISLRSSNAAWVTCALGRGQMADGESRFHDDDHENNVHHVI